MSENTEKVEKKRFPYSPLECINILCMVALIVLTFVQVLSRYLIKDGSMAWTEEMIRIVFVMLIYSGMGRVVKYEMNFAVETNLKLPRVLYVIQQTIAHLAEVAVMVVIIYGATKLIPVAMTDRTPALQIPMAVYYIPLTFGAIFVIYHSVRKWLEKIKKKEDA